MAKQQNLALTELRILAALAVLAVHAGQKVGLDDSVLRGMHCVIQLFFILSGYLAAAGLARHPEPLAYYKHRAARLLPLYWLVLALRWAFDAVRCLLSGMTAAQTFAPGGPCGPGYLRYFVFLQMWLPSDHWMLWNNRNILWTMSSFAFFYLLAPWLYKICRRFWPAMGLLAVLLAVKGKVGACIEAALANFPADANISEFSAKTPVMTLYCFVFGMAVYAAVQEGRQFAFAAFCLLLAAFGQFQHAGEECVLAVLVLVAAQCPQGLGLPLGARGRRALDFVGAGSFWLYLAHPMVMELVPASSYTGPMQAVCFAAVFAAVFAVCYAVYAVFVRRFEGLFVRHRAA